MPPEREIHVEVAGFVPGLAGPVGLRLPEGARVADALEVLGVGADDSPGLGIWGRKVVPDALLHDGDRIECCRPLIADPKTARRVRMKR